MLRAYYRLTKPGIIYGNSLSVIAGFFLASAGSFDLALFVAAVLGISLVMASACVFNNLIDREIDSNMQRTQKRALVSGEISYANALFYATALGVLGFYLLFFYASFLAGSSAAIGFFFYVVAYSIAKRKSVHGTVVGSVAGAVPPVVGYTAVTNQYDLAALILFWVLVCWQMPHFYAIAIFRIKDYRAAKLPVLPIVACVRATKIQMSIYVLVFIVAQASLFFAGYTGLVYLFVTGVLGLLWFKKVFAGFKAKDNELWARGVFKFSLIVLLVFCLTTSVDYWLP